ncbi:MAG: hypothetical protein WC552_03840 [Candidatus Omnitrophota bacterium]
MSSRNIDYRERKDIILGIVVENYVKTVNPISSNFISQECPIDLSSATIRNILAELEEEGYLTHPHTSAGRIPTQIGYRYYVDHLMHEIELLEEEKKQVKDEYQTHVLELGALFEKTSEVLSDLTHYASIVSVDGWNDRIFYRGTSHIVGYPEFHDLTKIQYILHALEEKERILEIINRDLQEKIKIYIGAELQFSEMDGCSLVVSSYHSARGPSGKIAVLGPTRMDYGRVISVVDYFSKLMTEVI